MDVGTCSENCIIFSRTMPILTFKSRGRISMLAVVVGILSTRWLTGYHI